MYFNRVYKAGGSDTDPRQKKWAEYICGVCGYVHNYDVTGNSTWDYTRDRICPECCQLNPDDATKNLQAEIDQLTADKSKIEVLIEEKTALLEGIIKEN